MLPSTTRDPGWVHASHRTIEKKTTAESTPPERLATFTRLSYLMGGFQVFQNSRGWLRECAYHGCWAPRMKISRSYDQSPMTDGRGQEDSSDDHQSKEIRALPQSPCSRWRSDVRHKDDPTLPGSRAMCQHAENFLFLCTCSLTTFSLIGLALDLCQPCVTRIPEANPKVLARRTSVEFTLVARLPRSLIAKANMGVVAPGLSLQVLGGHVTEFD